MTSSKVTSKYVVYLSGSMFKDHEEHHSWRERATDILEGCGIQTLSPYRGRSARGEISKVGSYHYTESNAPIQNKLANLLVSRDLKDVQDCDMLLVNLQGTKGERPSIGTISELAWAHLLSKPVVCIVDEETTEDDYYKHPFMHMFVDQWVRTIDEGIEAIVNFWHPEAPDNGSN